MNAAELEIALHRRDAESYHVDLRFHQPESDADGPRPAHGSEPLRLDRAALLAADPAAHGRELAQRLFTDTKIADYFDKVRAVAASHNAPLRVRFLIGATASELHNLRWETLLDPATETPLLTNENIVFSRYLSSSDWRPVRLRPQRDLTALVVIANPSNITKWNMAAVNVAQELKTARSGLGDIPCTELAEPGRATLDNMVQHLREEPDILYIVAHGALINGEPVLYLEDAESGQTKPIRSSDLVTRLRELPVRPQLIVLASCQSAGQGSSELTAHDDGALAAQLAEAGVPAVLAMQGNISMETVRHFMPVFFTELRRDGQIDRALAAARGRVRGRHDWWMPVLYMRLRDGQLFQAPLEGEALQRQMLLDGTFERKSFEPETVLIPGGPFIMGSDSNAPAEAPQHEVTLPDFRMGKYPVTNTEYAEFLRQNPAYPTPTKPDWFLRQPPAGKEDHPVVGINWRDAVAYCEWLSRDDVTGRHYRLPSEAEWERAARGLLSSSWLSLPSTGSGNESKGSDHDEVSSTGSDTGRRYPWGNEWRDNIANVDRVYGDDTSDVTQHPTGASSEGCLDMLGNVQEWTCTVWGSDRQNPTFEYPYTPNDGREELDADRHADQHRIHRGGSFRSKEADVRCSARGFSKPESAVRWRGFRVMMQIVESE